MTQKSQTIFLATFTILVTLAVIAGCYFVGFKILIWLVGKIAHAIKTA